MCLCGYTQQQKYTSVFYIKVDNNFVYYATFICKLFKEISIPYSQL
jgi:hypothetical protein